MISRLILEKILKRILDLRIAVVGDLFLDRYLDVDAALTEPSLETGLDAYQVVGVRSLPGAAGTIINNLAVLGVGEVCTVAVIGDDGEGHELRLALRALRGVDARDILSWPDRRTPTYTKPMLHAPGHPPRELNRLDIKNHTPLPRSAEDRIIESLTALWPRVHAVIALDQVSEADCGVITSRVREYLATLANTDPDKLLLADSRERIGLFRGAWLKPNRRECVRAVGADGQDLQTVRRAARELAERTARPVLCTCGEEGLFVVDPRPASRLEVQVPATRVTGPIDPVGAGDSVSAALACAIGGGASLPDAAAFANLVASITIQQIGTTGTASPEPVRRRWQELNH